MKIPPSLLKGIFAIIAGTLLPLAFAPFHLFLLAILSPAALLLLLQNKTVTSKRSFLIGFGYGLGMFGVGVSWVFVSIHRYGNTNIPLAIFLTSLFVAGLAIFPALQCYVLKKFFRGNALTFALLGFPSIWVLFEWFRSFVFTGFPWLFLGYTELNTPLAGFAPILSVYGVSLAVVFTSGALVAFIKGTRNTKVLTAVLVILVWGTGLLLQPLSFTTPSAKTYTVSLVQGNVGPLDKFSKPDPLGSTDKIYGKLTQPVWGRNLILWPEGVIPVPLPYAKPYIDKLQDSASAYHSTLIAGVQIINGNGTSHNSLIALGYDGHDGYDGYDGSNGADTGNYQIYHKYHLLPFGDFVPFEQWLRGLINFFDLPNSSFVSGNKNQNLITAGSLKLNPLICYEIAFPELVRDTLRNADAIITLSEDGWFGGSFGPHQHLEIAQMRALETGRYVLRATTSGITAIINPKGELSATLPQFQAAVLNGTFQAMTGVTPWVKMGLWPLIIFLVICFIVPGRLPNPFKKRRT